MPVKLHQQNSRRAPCRCSTRTLKPLQETQERLLGLEGYGRTFVDQPEFAGGWKASATVIFLVMAILLLLRPAGLFGRAA